MKKHKMTRDEFARLLRTATWTTEQDYDNSEQALWSGDEDDSRTVVQLTGHVWRTSETMLDGVRFALTFDESWNALKFDADSLNHSESDDTWELYGVQLVDDSGEDLDSYDIAGELSFLHGNGEIPETMTDIDWNFLYSVAGFNAVDDLDLDNDTDNDMETFTLTNDNAPDVRFTGELIANSSSWSHDRSDRWTELYLYRTSGGKYVCHTVGESRWVNETTRNTVVVCDTMDDATDAFGAGWLAKELYADAGIEYVRDVD